MNRIAVGEAEGLGSAGDEVADEGHLAVGLGVVTRGDAFAVELGDDPVLVGALELVDGGLDEPGDHQEDAEAHHQPLVVLADVFEHGES